MVKQNENNIFYKALFINLNRGHDYSNCLLQLHFLKRNILLNLIYLQQVDNFLESCRQIIEEKLSAFNYVK